MFRHTNTIPHHLGEPQDIWFNGEPLQRGYLRVHDFKTGKGYGGFQRQNSQLLAIMNLGDGTSTYHA